MLIETNRAGAPFPHCCAAHGASGGPRAPPEGRNRVGVHRPSSEFTATCRTSRCRSAHLVSPYLYVLCPSVRSDHGMIQPCSNAAEHGRIRVGPESEQGREKGPYVGQLICSDPDPTLFRPCSNLTGSDQVGVHIRSDQGWIGVGTGQSGRCGGDLMVYPAGSSRVTLQPGAS